MTDTDKFIDYVSRGFVPPLPQGLERESIEVLSRDIYALPSETVPWIGTVRFKGQLAKWGQSRNDQMLMGISPYRLVFVCPKTMLFGALALSYWFEVDLEGHAWQRGGLRNKEYLSLCVDPPTFNKGMLTREIIIKSVARGSRGDRFVAIEITLSDLKVRNPQTKEFEGGKGKAEALYQQIMDIYTRRQRVTLHTLMLTVTDPNALDAMAGSQTTPPPPQATAPTPALQPASIKAVPVPAPHGTSGPMVCPTCGTVLRPGVKFCGACGQRLAAPAPTPVAQLPSSQAVAPPSASQVQPMLTCVACRNTLKPGAKFCGHCGAKAVAKPEKKESLKEEVQLSFCINCGKQLQAEWKVCPFCGAAV
jgi:RNA polymerase subunit RPABC4/transcription elongation factor Spt4